ncbi:MAG TPA: alpha/beta hydrolase [Methylomirabilota bacterium]|jgi:pimeloyl-ACP methyl ester carboxylesterase|nr:alpha/beta hydrolase [Methylomirabilota bacterium]
MTIGRLGCELASARTLDVSGLRLHVLESGVTGSPALCFLHGGAAHAHWFDGVTPAFVDRFHVVSLDQRGHGQSEWAKPPAYATEDFASDLLGMMDALGWRRMTVVGHSMGGHNAMAFAAWHPERVSALVIVDSRPSLPPDRVERMRKRGQRPPRLHGSMATALQSFRLLPPSTTADPELLAHMARAGLVERDGGFKYRFDPACYAARHPADCWPLLPRITAPTLIVRGELSPILPVEMAERIRAAIPGSEIVAIPAAHHHLTLDQPEKFTAALTTFLGRV